MVFVMDFMWIKRGQCPRKRTLRGLYNQKRPKAFEHMKRGLALSLQPSKSQAREALHEKLHELLCTFLSLADGSFSPLSSMVPSWDKAKSKS